MKFLFVFFIAILPFVANAADGFYSDSDSTLLQPQGDTSCATSIFADALYKNSSKISETDSQHSVRTWVYDTIQSPDVITEVLRCPEFLEYSENDKIRLLPISYTFPGGRGITINYQVQPKTLKQILALTNKNLLPTDNPNPQISLLDEHANWTFTEPAWYGIMVTQSGALRDFVGPDKNNVISFQYIKDNIAKLYPHSEICTTKNANAKSNKMINYIMRSKTLSSKKDSNYYYISGDPKSHELGYNELATNVILNYADSGKNSKLAHSQKIISLVKKNLTRLSKDPDVSKYKKYEKELNDTNANLEAIKNLKTTLEREDALDTELRRTPKDSTKYQDISATLNTVRSDKIKYITKIGSVAQDANLAALNEMSKSTLQNISSLQKDLENLKKSSEPVRYYIAQNNAYNDTLKYADVLRNYQQPSNGNIVPRSFRNTNPNAYDTRPKKQNASFGIPSAKSNDIRNKLFYTTKKNLDFALDETANNLKFNSLLLLSAVPESQTNQTDAFGMWLMWTGNSMIQEYDDAAYLQALDFAQKFHQDLEETQVATNKYACAVDIYVVRPIIRNFGTAHQSLYWLVMNDIPWSTSAE